MPTLTSTVLIFFVVEKPGLKVAVIAGIAKPMGAQQDGVDNDNK